MASETNGGPAFPNAKEVEVYRDGEYHKQWWPMGGMSLRDYFAAQAIAAQADYPASEWNEAHAAKLATRAYMLADAMLKAREATHGA